MNDNKLQELARERAQELPGAGLEHPFGPEWEVFKVHDKVFMLVTEVTGESIVIVKAAPEDGKALREQHEDITPGYHMNKQHWITLHPGRGSAKAARRRSDNRVVPPRRGGPAARYAPGGPSDVRQA